MARWFDELDHAIWQFSSASPYERILRSLGAFALSGFTLDGAGPVACW